MRPRFFTGLAAAVAIALVLGVSTAPRAQTSPGQAARRLSPAEMAKVCADRTNLQNTIADAQSQVDLLRQVISNYGFERTAAEFDAMTESLQSGLQRQTDRPVVDAVVAPSQRTVPALELAATKPSEMQKTLLKMVTGKALESIKSFVEGLRPASPNDLRNLQQYTDIVQHLPMGQQLRNELIELAKSPDAQRRLLGYTKAVEAVDLLLSMATSDSPVEILWEGIMAAAGVINPALGVLAKEVDWAGRNLYDAVTGQWTNLQIDRLTTMTEEQLRGLRSRTEQLAAQTRRLRDGRNALTALPPCDTTQLANARPAASPPPVPPAPPAQPPAAKSSGGKGKWIALAATGSGAAGYFLWCKQQPWNSACSWMNTYDDGGGYSGGGGGGSSGGGSSGGGSSGGGGGATTQCLSTCSCIGSLNRSCTGSVQGTCGFPANPPGGSAGAVCGTGAPCRAGLACVNGRCTDIGPTCQ